MVFSDFQRGEFLDFSEEIFAKAATNFSKAICRGFGKNCRGFDKKLLHIQDARQCISTERQYRGLTGKNKL